MKQVWVLLKQIDNGETAAHSAYTKRSDLEARVQRIADRNPKYPMRQLSANSWRIGPDEYLGFFGDKPIYLRAVVVHLDSGVALGE